MLEKLLAFVKFRAGRRERARRDPAPDFVRAANAEWALVPHIKRFNGYPFLDWDAAHAWVESLAPRARSRAWWACERAWLLHFRDALGSGYKLEESAHAAVVSALGVRKARALLDYMERTMQRINRVLAGLARMPEWGKDVLIVFNTQDEYYRYVAYYYPEKGEFSLSGGMYLGSGCGHFVTTGDEIGHIEPTIAHEMTHGCLGHLTLPVWLNEGLAVNTERRLAPPPRPLYTPSQLHQKHERFWSARTIQEFWSGKAFSRPDEGNMLSYDLARILVDQFARSWEHFKSFVLEAAPADAGAAAAQRHLRLDLGAAVQSIFGKKGSWSPRPEAWS